VHGAFVSSRVCAFISVSVPELVVGMGSLFHPMFGLFPYEVRTGEKGIR